MASIITDNRYYTEIASAIRTKNGQSTTYRPAEMGAAIEALTTVQGTVQNFYTGTEEPSSSIGSDGDLYLKVVG